MALTIEELERRLRLLEDERELRSLLSRHCFNADLGRSRAYAELYADDGAIDLGTMAADHRYRRNPVRFVGREQILFDFITGRTHRNIEGDSQHHTTGPHVFYIEGDSATAEGYSFVLVRRPEGIEVYSASFNRWTFQRSGGQWKIAERFARAIGTEESWDVITRTAS